VLYLSDYFDGAVRRYNGTTGAYLGDFVPAGSGGLAFPVDLTFGPDGNLYVALDFDHSVLRYNGTSGAFIGAFVPSGSAGLDIPQGLLFTPEQTSATTTITVHNVAPTVTAVLDPIEVGFGDHGVVATNIDHPSGGLLNFGAIAAVDALGFQADGKIIAAG